MIIGRDLLDHLGTNLMEIKGYIYTKYIKRGKIIYMSSTPNLVFIYIWGLLYYMVNIVNHGVFSIYSTAY